jgi:hypothetical protein
MAIEQCLDEVVELHLGVREDRKRIGRNLRVCIVLYCAAGVSTTTRTQRCWGSDSGTANRVRHACCG